MENSLRGKFILAARHLRDRNFFRSVVLMIEHNEEGALGVIVNRPSSVQVSHALFGHYDVSNSKEVIFVGGPVEPTALCILHRNTDWGDCDHSIIPGVFIGHCAEEFEAIVQEADQQLISPEYRIYSGYSGWSPGQLEEELSRGDWYTVDSSCDKIFQASPYHVWDDLLAELQQRHQILPIPNDKAEWN